MHITPVNETRSISILSYNINGLENKYLYPTFFQYITQYEVFLLLETHLERGKMERAKTYFIGYQLVFEPAIRVHRFGRAIGGIIIGIKQEMIDMGVSYEIIHTDDKLIIKLQYKEQVYTLIPQYLRPSTWDHDFRKLSQIFQTADISNQIVIGDLNARIGEVNQSIGDIYRKKFYSGYDLRKSKDKIVNQKGSKFIQLCDDYNMLILNGITKGDKEGDLTYISTLGDSVNDLCAVSKEVLERIVEFRVEDKVWSDHFPILVRINIGSYSQTEEKMSLLPKLIWKENNKNNYQRRLNINLEVIQETTQSCLEAICKAISRSYPTQYSNKPTFQAKQKWYNNTCNKARLNSFNLLKIYRRTGDLDDKRRYSAAQIQYKNICNISKSAYYKSIGNNLNSIRNAGEWWKMARELRNESNFVGINITPEIFKCYYSSLLNNSEESTLIYYAPTYKEDVDLDTPIIMSELEKIFACVKRNKAPGEDRIPYEFYINGTEQLHTQLLNVYNNIFSSTNIDTSFTKTVIFPIHKKGDFNEPSNYRGISFMNCAAKIFMGIINERLYNWVEKHEILNEYQAGFRRNYSTVDNIYNLASIVELKLAEKKKVYSFFIDFKAAFDNISRQALIYKLFRMGISYKMVTLIERIYNNTQSAVWNGRELSDFFPTTKGVKQGCLLSPLLFALYINDLHEHIGGGLFVDNINIRSLLYADDIVLLADDIAILQKMIDKVETYCKIWCLEVNLSKSEIMVFRNGGKLSKHEKWMYNGREIKISNEFKYLGVTFTPKMKFLKHVQNRNKEAKNAINSTWKQFIGKADINMNAKWKLFLAVCRSIQTYAAQVWGFTYFEESNTLLRFFLKRILRVPSFTPNHILMLETDVEDTQIYTLGLHLNYLGKTLFQYSENRLPQKLTQLIYRKNTFWAKELKVLAESFSLEWSHVMSSQNNWFTFCQDIIKCIKLQIHNENIRKKENSQSQRIYRHLKTNIGHLYLNDKYSEEKIICIFKARSGMIPLEYNRFDQGDRNRECKLCNMREVETMQHFLGICPVLREFRMRSFRKPTLDEEEIIKILNGEEESGWNDLTNYIEVSYKYRQLLINEFN